MLLSSVFYFSSTTLFYFLSGDRPLDGTKCNTPLFTRPFLGNVPLSLSSALKGGSATLKS